MFDDMDLKIGEATESTEYVNTLQNCPTFFCTRIVCTRVPSICTLKSCL